MHYIMDLIESNFRENLGQGSFRPIAVWGGLRLSIRLFNWIRKRSFQMTKIVFDVLDWNNPKLCKLRFPRWTHSAVYEKHHITSEENSEMKFWLMYHFPWLISGTLFILLQFTWWLNSICDWIHIPIVNANRR